MEHEPYTLAQWRVKPGHEAAFVKAWHELAAFFLGLAQPPRWGMLLQSADDSRLFYSFGPWPSLETIAAMRADPRTPDAMSRLTSHCEEAQPGTFLVAAVAGNALPISRS